MFIIQIIRSMIVGESNLCDYYKINHLFSWDLFYILLNIKFIKYL